MKCRATVYYFRSSLYSFNGFDEMDETLPPATSSSRKSSLRLEFVASVEVKASGLAASEVAASAWIEAVGREWQAYLISLGAPAAITEAQVDILVNARDYVREAPAAFGGLGNFIYDNFFETWLIELGCETVEKCELLHNRFANSSILGSISLATRPRHPWNPELN